MDNLVLGTVTLYAKDLKKMVAFYRDALGFAIIPSRYDPGEFVVLDAGNTQLCLHQIPEVIARNIESSDPSQSNSKVPAKITFVIEDIEGMRERLIARGLAMGSLQSFPPLLFCDGQDPEGNLFQITNGHIARN